MPHLGVAFLMSANKGMIVKDKILTALLFSVAAIQPVQAQDAQEVTPQANSQEASSQESPDAAVAETYSAPLDSALVLPKLNITWDCGDCEHNDKVPPLIEQAYIAEAKKHSLAISETEIAEVAITDIRQRPPGVRIMFGIMAGKDRLGVRIRYLDQEHMVSHTSANAIMGLNHLSESVGQKTYVELATVKSAE